MFCTYIIAWKLYDKHFSIYENCMTSIFSQPGSFLPFSSFRLRSAASDLCKRKANFTIDQQKCKSPEKRDRPFNFKSGY